MARQRKTPEVVTPTVTDAQYKELLAIRLTAMHGFESGEVDQQTMLAARAAVRKARKVRKAEEANGVLSTFREHEEKLAAEAEAKKQARRTARKPRTKKVTQPATVTEDESDVIAAPTEIAPAEVAA